MLKKILDQIAEELRSCGVKEVYTAFDNIPIEKKGAGIYTVAAIESFESSAPIYSDSIIYLPFKAEASISLIAPQSMTMAKLYDCFDADILPIIDKMGSLTCSLRNLTMKNDANIRKLVLKVRFSASGISRLERSSS